MKIEDLIYDLSRNPFDPELNFQIANEYHKLNQTASAVSFYLRCAEYGDRNSILTYASLLKMADCFNDQQGREFSVSNCILQAISVQPNRPEAWLALSKFYESLSQWQECYAYACVGLGNIGLADESLPVDVGYYGSYTLHFQKAVAAWWIGRKDEALSTLKILSGMDLNPMYRDAVKHNLEKINVVL